MTLCTDKKYFSIITLADYLEVKPRTIRFWMSSAVIPYYKFGKHIRFDKAKIEKWEKSKEVPCFKNQYN